MTYTGFYPFHEEPVSLRIQVLTSDVFSEFHNFMPSIRMDIALIFVL